MGPSQGPGPEGGLGVERGRLPIFRWRFHPRRLVAALCGESKVMLHFLCRSGGRECQPIHYNTPNLGGMIGQSSAPCAPGCRAKKFLCWFWLGVGATKLPMMQESLKDWSRAAQAWAERAELMEMGKWTCRPKVRAATGAQFIQEAPSLHSRPAIASSLLESGILQGTGSSETQKQLQSIQPALPF